MHTFVTRSLCNSHHRAKAERAHSRNIGDDASEKRETSGKAREENGAARLAQGVLHAPVKDLVLDPIGYLD